MGPRDDLVRRATAHLAAHGVGNVSLRGLATAIGTSHRMLLYHFGSRDGLLTAVAAQLWQDQQAILDTFVTESNGSLRAAVWNFWTAVANADRTTPLLFELAAAAMHGAPWRESFREAHLTWVHQLRALLVAAGEPADRADLVAHTSLALVRGALWEIDLTGDRAAADATIRALVEEHWPDRPVRR